MVQPDISAEKDLYLKGLKYRDIHEPYNDFLMYQNLVLFAHQNIVSIYDMIEKTFVQHIPIGNGKDLKNQVLAIFKCKKKKGDSNEKDIAILMQDGSIKKCEVKGL